MSFIDGSGSEVWGSDWLPLELIESRARSLVIREMKFIIGLLILAKEGAVLRDEASAQLVRVADKLAHRTAGDPERLYLMAHAWRTRDPVSSLIGPRDVSWLNIELSKVLPEWTDQ
jgi:hypothetical protein